MWLFDLIFKPEAREERYRGDWKKILCRIYLRRGEGALSTLEVNKENDIKDPLKTYNFLENEGMVKHWTYHGTPRNPLNMSFYITRKGEQLAIELLGIKGEDGLPLLGDHLGGDGV